MKQRSTNSKTLIPAATPDVSRAAKVNGISSLFFLMTAFLLISVSSTAQSFDRRNSVMIESNFIMSLSLSYDRIVPISEKTAFTFGADYLMGVGFGYGSHWLSPEVGLLAFGPKHFLELGAMYAYDIIHEEGDYDNSPALRLAYRFQGHRGLTIRANANFYFQIDPIFIPTIGIGYTL